MEEHSGEINFIAVIEIAKPPYTIKFSCCYQMIISGQHLCTGASKCGGVTCIWGGWRDVVSQVRVEGVVVRQFYS